jgi:ketol-acid reductoisomerase
MSPSRCAKDRQRPRRPKAHGFKVMTPAEGAKWADVVMMLTPDELQADIYADILAGNIRTALRWHSPTVSTCISTDRATADLDVFMVAPKGPGHTVRSNICVAAAFRP